MEVIRLYLFPTALVLAAGYLLRTEWLSFRRDRIRGRVYWTRFLRRMVGALVVMAIAVMVHLGDVVPADASQGEAWKMLSHWTWVMGLLLLVMVLALWDAVDGVRNLRSYFEDIEKEEVERIREHLQTATKVDRN